MAGLFLNFFKVEVENHEFEVSQLLYEHFEEENKFSDLIKKYPDFHFYRIDDRVYYWNKNGLKKILPLNSIKHRFNVNNNPKLFSKIIESCLINKLRSDDRLKVWRLKHSFSWEVISSNNILKGIDGLVAYNSYNISPKFFYKNDNLILGYTISLKTNYHFKYNRESLEKKGFDTTGLKGNETEIFANTQSVSRYVKAMGKTDLYESFKSYQDKNDNNYSGIIKFVNWLNNSVISQIKLPNDNKMKPLTAYNIPSNEFGFEVLRKPKRFFYSGKEDIKGLRYHNEKVKEYKPVSYDEINGEIKVGVICPQKYEGRTESFLKVLKNKLESELHISSIDYKFLLINDESVNSYSEAVYNEDLLKSDIVLVIVSEDQKKLSANNSPYYYCKAKLIGTGIPTQDIRIETINQGLKSFAMTNLTLNIYAKIGGTAWTIEKEDKLKKEFIIGIGSSTLKDGKHVLGLAQIFDPDGRYLVGDCAPISSFDNYKENLKDFLKKIIQNEIQGASITSEEEFRLIFHIYKSPSSKYEISAVKEVVESFTEYSFKYALIHLAYGHNYRLFYGNGKYDVSRGLYLPLDDNEALLNFVPKSNLPLKIKLDRRSTFQDLQYLSQQVYWFSDLSHRSYLPAKRTVTLMYPSLMVSLTEKLKEVEGWDFQRLKHINNKLWFI